LRPLFEWILLAGSLLAGLGVIGACAVSGSGDSDTGDQALSVLGGLAFAIVLVGAVYLLTTMSRDLRRLREHYVDNAAISTTQTDVTTPGEPRADT
jgi:hypothetical protein